MQTVFAWLERWLAQRRTREIMGVLFILIHAQLSIDRPDDGASRKIAAPRVQPRSPDRSPSSSSTAAWPRRRRHRTDFPCTVPAWLRFPALPGNADPGRRIAATPPAARAVSRRESQRSRCPPRRCTSTGPASGMEPARIFAVGRSGIRKGNALSGAQRSHAAHLDHADLYAADLSPGTDEFPAALEFLQPHAGHGIPRRGGLRDPGPHQPGLQQFRRRWRRHPILLCVAGQFPPDHPRQKT